MMKRLFYILLLCIATVACDKTETRNDGGGVDVPPSGVGTGQRPGVGNPTDEDVLLADATPRYISATRSMRGDEPGVLVSRTASGDYLLVSLDTRERVDIAVDAEGAIVKIAEDGKEIRPDAVTVVADDGTTMWMVAETSAGNIAIVLPHF